MEIKVYGKPNCPQCETLKSLLNTKGQEYEYIDMSQDIDALNEVKAQGFRSAPCVKVDGEWVANWKEVV